MIDFRPLRESDLPLFEDWLRRDHVVHWWREPIERELEERRAAIAGDRPSGYYVIVVDGRPVGQVQTYLASDDPEWQSLLGVGEGVAGIDILIGEKSLIGRGLGPRVLAAFVRQIVFADDGVHACVTSVEETNQQSWRAFEKAGFRHVGDVDEGGRPHRVLRLDRPSESG